MGYWIAAYGVPFIAILVIYGMVSAQAARRTGSRPASPWLLPVAVLAAFMVTVQGIYDHLAVGQQERVASVFYLLGAILLWGFLARRMWRASRAGRLLLDLGRLPPRRLWFFGACAAIGVLATAQSVSDWRLSGFHAAKGFTETLFWLTLTLESFSGLLSRLQVRENGILAFFELIEWDRIDSYEWMGGPGGTLILSLRRQAPFFGVVPGKVTVSVPSEHRQRVEQVLADRCSLRQNAGG
jgi:hypothetical protein